MTRRLPRLTPDEVDGGAVQIARMVRAAWLLPRGPVPNVTNLLEAAGVVVVPVDFGTTLVDATSISSLEGLPPIIFVSKHLTGDRLRFTLSHELAHLVMHAVPSPEMEDEADEFAAEFLMPSQDISPELTGINLQRAAALKRVWKVSIGALLYRARELGKLSEDAHKRFMMKMNALGIKSREPPELDIEIERAARHQELLELHVNKLGYSMGDLCKLLGIFPDDFEELHGSPERARALKLVKTPSHLNG